MQALPFIEQQISAASQDGCHRAQEKYSQCLRALRGFLGAEAERVMLLEMMTPAFGQAFLAYLTAHPKGYSAHTVEERMQTLRGFLRTAIKGGILPNLSLSAEGGRELSKLPSQGRSADLSLVLAQYARLAGHIRTAEMKGAEADKIFSLRERHRLLGLGLLSLLCGGIGLAGLAALRAGDYEAPALHLPRLNATLTLPESISLLLDDLRAPAYGTDAPLLDFGQSVDAACLEPDAVQNTRRAVLEALADLSPRLPDAWAYPFTLWVEIARERGVPTPVLHHLIDARFGRTSLDVALMQQAVERVAHDFAHISRRWFGISCKGISASRLRDDVLQEGECHIAPADFYAPYDEQVKEVGGKKKKYNNPVLDRLLFFRANQTGAHAMQRALRQRGIIYGHNCDGQWELCAIPDREILNLQRFLAVRNANRIALTPDMEHYGKHVRVIAGIFAGCEGVIEGPSSRRRARSSRLNPAASALNPAASPLNPSASALNPSASPINPAASALNPSANAFNSAASPAGAAASGLSTTLCVRIMGTTVAAVADIDRDYLVEV